MKVNAVATIQFLDSCSPLPTDPETAIVIYRWSGPSYGLEVRLMNTCRILAAIDSSPVFVRWGDGNVSSKEINDTVTFRNGVFSGTFTLQPNNGVSTGDFTVTFG
jgi:hypothetical protein